MPDGYGAGYTCSASSKKYTSCKSGYYLNGTGAGNSCSTCSSLGYTSSANGNSNGAAACYKSCTKACTRQTCPSNATCTHGSSSTSGTQYYGGSCSSALSTPSLNIGTGGGVCYGILESGAGTLNIQYDGKTYHAVD